jgi:PA14 domain
VNAFTGCYYGTGPLFFNTLLAIRTDAAIQFNWTGQSPTPAVPNNNYSTHWAGNFSFDAGTYVFTVTTNDGSRLWIDPTTPITQLSPNPLMDVWFEQNTNTCTPTVTLTAGMNLVRMDYFKSAVGPAVAQLSWTKVH